MPERLIGISASYDYEDNPALKASNKYLKDISNGSSLKTIPIYRGKIRSVDNLKFMYPLGGSQVPIVAYTILNAVDQDAQIRVTGNDEVRNLVGIINDVLRADIDFVSEGDVSNLSLSNTFLKLFGNGLMSENYFVTGDIPFARDYMDSGYAGDIVLDFNTTKLLDGLTHTKRNFYNEAKIGGSCHGFKEPNVYFFSEKGFSILHGMADHFYRHRKAGGLPSAMVSYVLSQYSNDKVFKKNFKKNILSLGEEFFKIILQKMKIDTAPLDFDQDNQIMSKMYGLEWRFDLRHNDIFRMLDIDGLNNDWIVADGIARNIEKAKKLDSRLKEVSNAIRSEIRYFPLVENFNSIIEEYIRQINSNLPEEHHIVAESFEDFRKKYQMKEKGSIDELTALVLR